MKINDNCLVEVEPSDFIDGTIIIPPEIHTISSYAFQHCNKLLTHLEIPDTVERIGSAVFSNCTNLKSLTLPKNLKRVPEKLFENCSSLENIEIPEDVNFIGASAFENCSSLKAIKLPKKINEIYFSTFKNCTSLENVELDENILSIFPNAFESCTSLKEITIPKSTSIISLNCFANCTSLKSVSLPEGLIHLKSNAFENCTELENITLPSTLIDIGSEAFSNCSKLKTLTIPTKVSYIGNEAFKNCTSLENVEINNSKISHGEFSGCSKLKNVTINFPIIKIEMLAFNNCSELENIIFNKAIRIIEPKAFADCHSLKNLELPSGLTTIRNNAFENCENLESLNIPDSIQVIGDSAFENCNSLKFLSIPDSAKSIKSINSDSLLFFNKTETGFNLSSVQTPDSIPTKMINLNYSFLSKYWKYKDILLKEQKNPNIADFYNKFLSELPEDKIEKFIENHNFTFFKQFDFSNNSAKTKYFYKAIYNLGGLEKPFVNEKGKTIDYAQKVVGFIQEKLSPEFLVDIFLNMEVEGFKPEFTEFFINNILKEEMLKEFGQDRNFVSKCYNEFEEVQKTNTSNRGNQRQLKPTIEKFKSAFITDKYKGASPEDQEIVETIFPYFPNQSAFEHAIAIDKERKAKGTRNNILKEPLKESDVFASIDEYSKKVKASQTEVLGQLTDIASNEFSFEWLEKNDPENFILGKLCSCCAHLEGVGYGIMHASIVHPNIQNLVIRNKKGEIVAKSTLFINKLGRYGVCNNVEVAQGLGHHELEQIYQKFVLGIREFAQKYNKEHPLLKLSQINVGMGNNDLVYQIQHYRKESLLIRNAIDYARFCDGAYAHGGDSGKRQFVVWSDKEEKKIQAVKIDPSQQVNE